MMNELNNHNNGYSFSGIRGRASVGSILFYSPLADSEEAPGYAMSLAPNVSQFCFAYGCGAAGILLCNGRAMGTAGGSAYGFYFNEDDPHTPHWNG